MQSAKKGARQLEASPDPPSAVAKPVKTKKISTGKAPHTKMDPPAPNSKTTLSRSDSSVKNLSSKLKHQHTFVDNLEEDGDESDALDLQPVKPQAIYRPRKLCCTYVMRDVSALSGSDSDDHPKANGNDSDADHEESEGEEPEATAMMLVDEVPSLVSNKSKQIVQSHGKSQSACDTKQAAEAVYY
ncbi:hypothetical protein DFH29DRAFT_1010876 [Suillus ampliporus]|nr:hypothetical protein DFH29DRAFT_1010876 [Suillus ampliporus]